MDTNQSVSIETIIGAKDFSSEITPGPWALTEGEGDGGSWEACIWSPEAGVTICRLDNEAVAFRANTSVLVSAPKLLSALRVLVHHCSFNPNNETVMKASMDYAVEAIHEAINYRR